VAAARAVARTAATLVAVLLLLVAVLPLLAAVLLLLAVPLLLLLRPVPLLLRLLSRLVLAQLLLRPVLVLSQLVATKVPRLRASTLRRCRQPQWLILRLTSPLPVESFMPAPAWFAKLVIG